MNSFTEETFGDEEPDDDMLRAAEDSGDFDFDMDDGF